MLSKTGPGIESISPDSIAAAAGISAGDVILRVNDVPMRDVIDFMFHKDDDELLIEFLHKGEIRKVSIMTETGADLGITFKPLKVKTCKNSCIFCFVKQLPRGLRKPLYIKDEDYRLSFLYGNYMTLSNLTPGEKQRIIEQRLSPLYISVHSTNRQLRNRMLGNPKAADILKELKFFASNRIRMHIQIVLCPGYNDGKELASTIQDIYRFHPYVSSIAVVPVGLTKHRRVSLNPVTRADAEEAIGIVDAFQRRFRKKHGEAIVYCADEMYIKAEKPFPGLAEFGDLPQIENGVGMVPLFMSQAKKLKIPKTLGSTKRFVTVTGRSFYPFLKKFISRLNEREHLAVDLIPVDNRFFGETVTVAGLLTGRDVITAVQDRAERYDILVVPDVVLREGDTLFLDNVSLRDIEDTTGLQVVTTDCTPQGFIETLAEVG